MAALLCSALSQEEQDDAQLKIEDILQMVSFHPSPSQHAEEIIKPFLIPLK